MKHQSSVSFFHSLISSQLQKIVLGGSIQLLPDQHRVGHSLCTKPNKATSKGRRNSWNQATYKPPFFLLPFFAQKTHVKPLIDLTQYKTTTSEWHFSYPQPAILNIEIETSQPRPSTGANSFRKKILDATPLL
jgi:hypothetical protein